jgi:hypothetical protein
MSVPGGVVPPPGGWGETQPLRLRRLDQLSRARRPLAEEFFAGPIPPAGGPSPLAHRWASGLAAAALSLTLVLSLVALAILGGGGEPGGQFSQAPLLAEGRGDPIRAVAPSPQEPTGLPNATTEPTKVAPPPAVASPTPAPVIEQPVADQGAEGGSRTGPAGGGHQGGGGGGNGGGGSGGGGGGGGETNTEVVPPIETGTDVGGIQPITPVVTDADADETPGSAGEAQDDEPQPPPEELPPCTVNEENGSEDEGADSVDEDGDEDDADDSDDSDDEDSEENGSEDEDLS